MATYDQIEELREAFAARAAAENALAEARTRLRAAARATGMGPTDLARELGYDSPSSAADLLKAEKVGVRPVRPSRLPKAKRRRPTVPAETVPEVAPVDKTSEAEVIDLFPNLEQIVVW